MTPTSRLSARSQWLVAGLRTAVHSWRLVAGQATPLPRLADICPEAWRASGRHLGLVTIPIRIIFGTAIYPRGIRRRDFLPVRGREPADWHSRWSRLVSSTHEQASLPPVDLVRAADAYWIIDGHNRVALALATGQVWIDADVVEVGTLSHRFGEGEIG